MAVGEKYRDLVDKRPFGGEILITSEIFRVPLGASSNVIYRMTEIPLNIELLAPYNNWPGARIECRETTSLGVDLPGPVTLEPIDENGTLIAGKFQYNSADIYTQGKITFHQGDTGRYFRVVYTGRGSFVYAEDVLNLNSGESLLPGTIKPGHISANPTDNFTFPGDITITGDINYGGVVNKKIIEVSEISDDIIKLNAGEGSPTGPNMGFEFDRGGANPKLLWNETDDSFEFLSTAGSILLKVYDSGSVMMPGGVFKVPSYTTAQEAALVITANIPGIFYNSDERQAKMVIDDGVGGATLAVMG